MGCNNERGCPTVIEVAFLPLSPACVCVCVFAFKLKAETGTMDRAVSFF
jgi:hypothetical protein